ncbi:terminase large subunit [Larkinella ripae]
MKLELRRRQLARNNLSDFIPYIRTDYSPQWFHRVMAVKLQQVHRRETKKLMLFLPPQHGKSEVSTRSFPAWTLGQSPDTKIAICSYSATLASSFNRDIQRRMDDDRYRVLFPDTRLSQSRVGLGSNQHALRNHELFEIVGKRGFVKTVGVGGSLTGTPVDLGIIDDPIKDRQEAQSLTVRESTWNWYTDVFETRLHNNSAQVLIMTRWHQDDPAGRLLERDGVWSLDNPNGWQVISFPGLKTNDGTSFDPRQPGEALWPDRHSREKLERIKTHNVITFNSLYQQDPKPSPEALVYPHWSTVPEFPKNCERVVYGLDFGFSNDPSALVKIGQIRTKLYLEEKLYKKGLTTKLLAKELRSAGIRYGDTIVADSAEPRTISDLRQEGFTIVRAIKGPGSLNAGIDTVRTFDLFVTEKSHNLQNELNRYEWIMEGGAATNLPIDAFNHALDASRYGARYLKQSSGGGIEQD